ncbi:MAG: hypothetical protein EZS28_005091 [Streblomastix strix]|uniref:Reverse transcriptase RNase H-like domain-containing protein n=1 Tax=Streblomastix strix TaxID=222440 RepID=A0A5J4WWQ5_9EUKA|nr:MAG: hypothetical protein EZS28_005091 [Streblomastix strix]
MGNNQSEQEQTGSQEINKIPGMELEYGINDAIDNQINEETGDSSITQTGTVDTVATVPTVRSAARLIGQIQYIGVQCTQGSPHITSMNREMSKRAKKAGQDSPIKQSRRALIEVEWWITLIKNNKSNNIKTQTTQATITTDASLWRRGVTFQILEENIQRIFKPWKAKIPTSNRREIDEILLELNYLQLILQFNHLCYLNVKTDNTIACRNLFKGKAMEGLRRSGFAIEARRFGRLLNRQINATASARRMGDNNYSQLLRYKEKYKTSQVLLN